MIVVAAWTAWAAFAGRPPVLEDAERVEVGMSREEVVSTLGREPDREWDHRPLETEAHTLLGDKTPLPPDGVTIHYLEWEAEGEAIFVRFYDGRMIDVGVTRDHPWTFSRRIIHWLRML
jgi:hypothetical protein